MTTAPPPRHQHPAHPANYDPADRPAELPLTTLVLHNTEETHADTLRIFGDAARKVSAHYLIRSQDGRLTQLVADRDVAWHAGNWYANQHSLGIEHEGYADAGHTWYTDAMYRTSAALIRELADRYGIPLDRFHLLGHDNVAPPVPELASSMHTDPGPHWDWARLLELLGHPIVPTADPGAPLLTVTRNSLLRAEPDAASTPAAGRVSAGQQFATAGRSGDWTALWYQGGRAWLYDPPHEPAAVPAAGLLVRPRGDRPVEVFGRAYPEPEAFPPEIPAPAHAPLPGALAPGQAYACGGPAPCACFHAPNDDPDARAVVAGRTEWLVVQVGHRLGFVRAEDVELVDRKG